MQKALFLIALALALYAEGATWAGLVCAVASLYLQIRDWNK